MVNKIQEEIKAFIVDTFLFGDGGDNLTSDISLLEQGIIDSTGVLELVDFLENTYKIEVEDDELIPDNLDSLKNIENYIIRKQKN